MKIDKADGDVIILAMFIIGFLLLSVGIVSSQNLHMFEGKGDVKNPVYIRPQLPKNDTIVTDTVLTAVFCYTDTDSSTAMFRKDMDVKLYEVRHKRSYHYWGEYKGREIVFLNIFNEQK